METTQYNRVYIEVILGIMERKWKLLQYNRVYIEVILGIMEKKMETTTMGLGFRV